METWKDIPGYEGLYQASNSGFIRSAEGKTTASARFNMRRWQSRILKGRGNNRRTGSRVVLWKNGEHKDCLVARLVALTFLGSPPAGYTVNHKDGNRLNNCVDNLEWLTLADNIRHGFDTGLYSCQTSITLKNDTSTASFRSMSVASKSIGRNKAYILDRPRLLFADRP